MATVLDFDPKPVLSTYLYSAYPIGIAGAAGREAARIYDYNIQIFMPEGKRRNARLHFECFPAITIDKYAEMGVVGFQKCVSPGGLIDQVAKNIERGMYIYVYADYFYIPNTAEYSLRHSRHELLVTGYDGSKGHLTVVTFLRTGLLGPTIVSTAEFERAYESEYGSGRIYKEKTVWTINRIDRRETYVLDYPLVRGQLRDYLNSHVSNGVLSRCTLYSTWLAAETARIGPGTFGISCYGKVLELMRDAQIAKDRFDLRVTRMLYEHKVLMRRRLHYLAGIISMDCGDWDLVVSFAYQLHLAAVDYMVNGSLTDFPKIGQRLDSIVDHEKRILSEVINVI